MYISMYFCSLFCLYSLIFKHCIFLLYLFSFIFICEKAVAKKHKAVCCDVCNKWVHIGYNNINTYIYRKLQKGDAPWYRKECLKKSMSFSNVTSNTLTRLFERKEIISLNLDKYLSDDNQISVELGKSIQNKPFTPDELNSYLANKKYKSLYLHLNISSLSYHCDNLSSLINNLKMKPKIIGTSECRIKKINHLYPILI